MSLSSQDIQVLANLSKLNLTAEEVADYTKQLGSIVDYVAKIQSVDVTDVAEMSRVDESLILRPDVVLTDSDPQKLVEAAPKKVQGFIITPPVRNYE